MAWRGKGAAIVLVTGVVASGCTTLNQATSTSLSESTSTTENQCANFIELWGVMLEQADALHREGLEAIQQWGEGTMRQTDLVDIADRIYLDYFDLGEELAELNPPPVGFERPAEMLLEAVGQLFQGYGNAWRALDSREMDDARFKEANTYLNQGGVLMRQTAEAVLESEIEASCAEALSRTVDTLD